MTKIHFLRKRTVIVGAGVVNLVTAYFLAKNHNDLVIIDKASSPLEACDWTKHGSTFGGENVRMYSFTEADNYNEKGKQLYANMEEVFEHTIGNNGWLVRDKSSLNDKEMKWINDFHRVTIEEAIQYAEDIYHVNIESGKIWGKWMDEAPELFTNLDFVDGILRIYSDSTVFQAAQSLHRRLGSLNHALGIREALAQFPVLQYAHSMDLLGGCMITKGFTLKVQDFCKKIIQYLANEGVEFRWNSDFTGIKLSKSGKSEGIFIDKDLEQFDNYILSLGAYAGTTLHNTQTNNQLHGVLGVWLTIPNLYPELKHSMKIHKAGHVGEDTNVTLIEQYGQPVLVLGSGYGYTGNSTCNHIKNHELEQIFNSLKNTARIYFPEAYQQAKDYIDDTKKYCVRAWTPTGLGIFESIPANNGGQLIITGGNNTGGFTQSPCIADAVLKSLTGLTHPIHSLYHPARNSQAAIDTA